ncbi:unnamed protein product [Prorocentrum cordatum]|uniref:DHHA2 domain-containing protein n=1 Tax=Prorocentrum cordatum TaxID=2364126 RepID=A0ABN9UJA7_9DINO|nr:unnamed protein product [Polarella glacialis]
MRLRSETVLLLQLCGVDSASLIFLDDPQAKELLEHANRVVLVDHNKATGLVADIAAGRVAIIVDHHKDLGQHTNVTGPARNIAFKDAKATAGSCCTLVAEAFLESPSGRALLACENGSAARALLGVILIDTVGLEQRFQKVTPRDVVAAESLQSLAPAPASDELFRQLDAAKFDDKFWEQLGADQCLRYDYKRFEAGGRALGLSSVLCSLHALVGKAGWAEESARWAQGVDLFGVLSNRKCKDGVARELLLMSSDGGALASEAAQYAARFEDPVLSLQPLPLPEGGPPGALAFSQGNSAASRKQVAPCLSAFLESTAGGAAL